MPAVKSLERSANVVFLDFLLTEKCAHNCIIGPKHPVKHVLNTAEKKKKENTCSVAKENATLAQWIEILDWHHG